MGGKGVEVGGKQAGMPVLPFETSIGFIGLAKGLKRRVAALYSGLLNRRQHMEKRMKILVTGGTGFTGKALVRRLLNDGHQVTALDYKEGLKTQELRQWGAEVVIGSVTDRAVVERCVQGKDVVQHLAAAFRELNVPESHYDEVNVGGTRIVLEAAKQAGVKKLVYCSTCGVHGNIDNPPGDETAPIQPADYYQKTKYQAEPYVVEYFRNHGDRELREYAELLNRYE